jgi:hypothetical protein
MEVLNEHGLDWPYTAAKLAVRNEGYPARGLQRPLGRGPNDATSAMGVPIAADGEAHRLPRLFDLSQSRSMKGESKS